MHRLGAFLLTVLALMVLVATTVVPGGISWG
jgi:hypothetical protein